MVAVRLEENRDPRWGRNVLRADRQSQLPPGPEWSLQYRGSIQEGHGCGDRGHRVASNTTGDSERRPTQSPDAHGDFLRSENRAADLAEHDPECRLHRLAWVSRNSFNRRQRAEECRSLPGIALPSRLSFRGIFLLRQPSYASQRDACAGQPRSVEHNALVLGGRELLQWSRGGCEPPVQPRAPNSRGLYLLESPRRWRQHEHQRRDKLSGFRF